MFKVNDLINDQYEVLGWSEGGMGRVYFVLDQVTQNHLVIKMIKEELKRSPEACARFEREAMTWINLKDHPHIVRAMSFHRLPIPFLLEELVDGPSLHALIKKEPGGLAFKQAVTFALHIARGLHHAHTRALPGGKVGIIHRDLKPHNILITRQCQAKIADFGLAKVVGDSSPATGEGALGTVQYMPPEQLRSARKARFRADIYSLGVTVYEMITGRLPFPKGSWHQVAYHIEKSAPEPISTYRPDVPAKLQDLIYACLQKKPPQRPASAEVVIAELEKILKSLPQEANPPCPRCTYLPRTALRECPVCGPPITFPNAESPAPPPSEATLWRCACGEDVPLEFAFCIFCGRSPLGPGAAQQIEAEAPVAKEPTPEAETNCPVCGTPNPAGFSFCNGCGSQLGRV